MKPRDKTHCYRGHPLSGDNLRLQPKGGRWQKRVCRACQAIGRRAFTIRRVRARLATR